MQVELRPGADQLAKLARGFPQRLRGAGRQRDQVSRVRRRGSGVRGRASRPLRPVLGQQAVAVGAAEAEGVDADRDGRLAERLAFGLHAQPGEVDVRVRDGEVRGDGSVRSVLEHEQHLQQRAAERGGLHVTHVALHAGDPQRRVPARPAEHLADRVPLDPVPDPGAGGVRLEIVHLAREQAGPRARGAHQRDLRVLGRRGDHASRPGSCRPVRGPRGVHRGARDDGQDPVPVRLRCRQRLDEVHEHALGAHVAVGRGVEGAAAAVRADHAQPGEPGADLGAAEVAGRADDRLVAVAAVERRDGRVQRGGARRARGHVGRRRAGQVERVGDPVGQHVEAGAGDHELVRPVQRAPVARGGHLRADEDSGPAVAQPRVIPAGPLERLPGAGQQHPQLRVHDAGLASGHAEQVTVEQVRLVAAHQALVAGPEPAWPRLVADRLVPGSVPAGDRLADECPLGQQLPETVGRADAARHPESEADDGIAILMHGA